MEYRLYRGSGMNRHSCRIRDKPARTSYLRTLTSFTGCVVAAGVTHFLVLMVPTVAVASPCSNGPSVGANATLQGRASVVQVIGVVETAWISVGSPRPFFC